MRAPPGEVCYGDASPEMRAYRNGVFVNEYYQYLMEEMSSDLNEQWQDDSERAHEFCFILSLTDQPVSETHFNFYAANVDVNPQSLQNAAAFFRGMNFLHVTCDCEDHEKADCSFFNVSESPFYSVGLSFLFHENEIWESMKNRISDVKSELNYNR